MRNGRGSSESRNDPVKRQMIVQREHYDKFLAKHKIPPPPTPFHLLSHANSVAIVNKSHDVYLPPSLFNLSWLQLRRPLFYHPGNLEFCFS